MSTKIPLIVPKRSFFNLSQSNLTTFGFGELIPTYYRDLLPGDHFKIKQHFNSRFLALLAPIMHKLRLCNSWFFVPYRLVWDNWEDFISPKDFLTGENVPAVPYSQVHGTSYRNYLNTLVDYLDMIPSCTTQNGSNVRTNLFYLAAYRKIWNDFYRDQNLQEEVDYKLTDGDTTVWDNITVNGLNNQRHIMPLARAYHSDYFTSALPWTQKGNPVFIPFAVDVNVNASEVSIRPVNGINNIPQSEESTGVEIANGTSAGTTTTLPHFRRNTDETRPKMRIMTGYNPSQYNDLFELLGITATGGNGTATINDLRTALALQRWLERNARGGTRYVEYIFAHFGVVSPDSRLQRAEFVGGNETPIAISEVLQTSQTTDNSPLGVPAGSAFSAGINSPVYYHAKEHGMLICITSLMFDNVYMTGQDRHNRKFDRFEFFTPSFANIGEQEIYTTELGTPSSANLDEAMSEVFGYAPRYEEYRIATNRVHGDMRDTLQFWHLARGLYKPHLNQAFIQSNNSDITDRIFPYRQGEFEQFKQFLCQMYFDVKALRPVPKHGLPSIL